MLLYELFQPSTLAEARIHFTPEDIAAKVQDPDSYTAVSLYVTRQGDIHMGYTPRGMTNRHALSFTLWPNEKRIDASYHVAGDKLEPLIQQAIGSLKAEGIIDDTWTVRTTGGVGRYVQGEYRTTKEPAEALPLDHWLDQSNRLDNRIETITLYHGTSSLDWEKIQRVGLVPLFHGANQQHGYESRAKHEGNQKVLYLATDMRQAKQYADTRVTGQELKLRDLPYRDRPFVEPVILRVTIPDPHNLVADDDAANSMIRKIGYSLWKKKPREEQDRIMAELSSRQGWKVDDPSLGQMLWRETDAGWNEIQARMPRRVFRAWLASLRRYQQVGYRGVIPPKFIERVF